MKKIGAAALVTLALSTIAAVRMGGWAVVSVEDVPDHLVVGKPTALTFQVRQHGEHPMEGLKPEIQARKGFSRVTGRVWEGPKGATYRASITVPEPGDWQITIGPNFGRSKGELLPMRAADSTETPAALGEAERGRRIFAARGCVTCHVHRELDIKGEVSGAGPELTNKRFAASYLAQFLADPSIKPASPNTGRMPNPRLHPMEIASLVAFINAPAQVSRR